MTTPLELASSAVAETVVGTVEEIYVCPTGGAPMESREAADAVAGRGLEGDRYFSQVGTYSDRPGPGRSLTMIDAAVLDSLEREHGVRLAGGASRRNLVVRGANLDDLVGRDLRVGSAVCTVVRDCPPCAYLESITQPGALQALVGRGGIRLDVLEGGRIRVGDAIRLLPRAAERAR